MLPGNKGKITVHGGRTIIRGFLSVTKKERKEANMGGCFAKRTKTAREYYNIFSIIHYGVLHGI
jgi:hypothetical protein